MGFRTQAQVDRLRPPEGKADAYVWDDECPGLSIRLQGTAQALGGLVRRKWRPPARDARRRQRPVAPAKPAASATRIVGDARDGKDALAERAAAKAKTADTLGQLVDVYLERRAKPRQRQRTFVEVERYLRKRWAPLHDQPLDSITRRDIAARLEEIRVDHGPICGQSGAHLPRQRVHLGDASGARRDQPRARHRAAGRRS